MSTTVDLYLDFVCPFCYLNEPAIAELIRDRDVDVRIHPFELNPEPQPQASPDNEHIRRAWATSLEPMARHIGVPIQRPTVDPQPRTHQAFMVLQLAQEQGLAQPYVDAVFAAYFQHNRDISDEAVITEIATSVGLDAAEVHATLADASRRARQREAVDYAVTTVGVRAVPTMIIGDRRLSGTQTADRLKDVVDAVAG